MKANVITLVPIFTSTVVLFAYTKVRFSPVGHRDHLRWCWLWLGFNVVAFTSFHGTGATLILMRAGFLRSLPVFNRTNRIGRHHPQRHNGAVKRRLVAPHIHYCSCKDI